MRRLHAAFLQYLDGVDKAAEILQRHILVVAEHTGVGVADQLQLVLVRPVHSLEHGGEGVAAAVGRVAVAAVGLNGVVDADFVQGGVKAILPPFGVGDGFAISGVEDRAGGAVGDKPVDEGLDLGADGDDPINARLGFGSGHKVMALRVVVLHRQLYELRGAVAQVAEDVEI